MATCCEIGFLNPDGTVTVSTIRSDGYLSGVGSVLFKHYTDPEKAKALCQIGWIYSIEAEIGDIEFESDDQDYPETLVPNPVAGAVLSFKSNSEWADITRPEFLFKDGAWFYGSSEYDAEIGTYIYYDYVPITRELLIADGKEYGFTHLEEYLVSTEPEPTTAEVIADIVTRAKEHSAKMMRENPGTVIFQYPRGVSCSSVDATGIDCEAIFDDAENAAKTGRVTENPYPTGSVEATLWEAYYSTQV